MGPGGSLRDGVRSRKLRAYIVNIEHETVTGTGKTWDNLHYTSVTAYPGMHSLAQSFSTCGSLPKFDVLSLPMSTHSKAHSPEAPCPNKAHF